METLKKFVKYYAPYKGVFFLDLLCAAIISFVDLAFPQILRSLTKTLFLKDAAVSGTYDGSKDGAGYAPGIV